LQLEVLVDFLQSVRECCIVVDNDTAVREKREREIYTYNLL